MQQDAVSKILCQIQLLLSGKMHMCKESNQIVSRYKYPAACIELNFYFLFLNISKANAYIFIFLMDLLKKFTLVVLHEPKVKAIKSCFHQDTG